MNDETRLWAEAVKRKRGRPPRDWKVRVKGQVLPIQVSLICRFQLFWDFFTKVALGSFSKCRQINAVLLKNSKHQKNMFHFVWGWFFSTNVCFCICTYAVIYCNPYILLLNFHVTDQYVSQNMWFIIIPPLSIANPNFIGTVYEPIWKMGWPSPIWSTGTEMVGSVSI